MTTRSEFDPSLARNYYDLWGTYSDANELLYARVAELEAEMTIINRALSDEGVTSHQLRVRVAELEAERQSYIAMHSAVLRNWRRN